MRPQSVKNASHFSHVKPVKWLISSIHARFYREAAVNAYAAPAKEHRMAQNNQFTARAASTRRSFYLQPIIVNRCPAPPSEKR